MPASSQSISIRPLLVTTSPCVWIPESSKKVPDRTLPWHVDTLAIRSLSPELSVVSGPRTLIKLPKPLSWGLCKKPFPLLAIAS